MNDCTKLSTFLMLAALAASGCVAPTEGADVGRAPAASTSASAVRVQTEAGWITLDIVRNAFQVTPDGGETTTHEGAPTPTLVRTGEHRWVATSARGPVRATRVSPTAVLIEQGADSALLETDAPLTEPQIETLVWFRIYMTGVCAVALELHCASLGSYLVGVRYDPWVGWCYGDCANGDTPILDTDIVDPLPRLP